MREVLFSVSKDDMDVTFFSGTGAGGQHRNKHQNCVRIIHRESGAIGVGQNSRKRQDNQRDALRSLVRHPRFCAWHRMMVQLADPSTLRIETFNGTGWVTGEVV